MSAGITLELPNRHVSQSQPKVSLLDAIQRMTMRNIEVRFLPDAWGTKIKCIEHFGRDYRYEHTWIFDRKRIHHSVVGEQMIAEHLLMVAQRWDEFKELAKGREELSK